MQLDRSEEHFSRDEALAYLPIRPSPDARAPCLLCA
jgi:hypothetical protein